MTHLTIYSDLHLEHSNVRLSPRGKGPICFLGDLYAGRGEISFVDWLERQPWAHERPIVIIPGNHDFEAVNIEDAVDDLKILSRPHGWHVLHNETLVIDGVRLFGSPWYPSFDGWAEYPEVEEALGPLHTLSEADVFEWLDRSFKKGPVRLNDLKICKDHDQFWSVPQLVGRHREAKKSLERVLDEPFEGSTVVLTHWGPTAYTRQVYKKNLVNLYYQNRNEDLLQQVNAWFHGHQHESLWYHCGLDQENGWVGTNARGVSPTSDLSTNGFFLRQGLLWDSVCGMDFDGVLKEPLKWGNMISKKTTGLFP